MPRIRFFRAALTASAVAALLAGATPSALAQNIAIVNGKGVPKSRVDAVLREAARSGQDVSAAEIQQRARDEMVRREVFAQEAERRGLARSPNVQSQMELARQGILIRELFDQEAKGRPVSDADARTEYDRLKTQNAGQEYRARHILVESEDEAKALITQLKGGASFEELAKARSKDPGSGANGGDLDFAKADSYVPEFSKALTTLKKGELTQAPVKTQFGWHVIRLDDTRAAQFPEFDAVKPQIVQHLQQQRIGTLQQQLLQGARTDYKFGG